MRGLSIILVIVVAVILAVFFIGKSRLPNLLANNFSKKLGVSVSIAGTQLGLSNIDVDKLSIGNPKGYSLPKAFSADVIDVDAPLTHFFKDELVVDLVEVKDIYLGIEFDSPAGTNGNWKTILGQYQRKAGLDEKGKKVLIKKIVFTNITTDLLFKTEGTVRRLPHIKRIELTNISTEGGFPMDQLLSSILGQMLKEVFIQQNLNSMLKGLLNPSETLDSFIKPFKGIFNAVPKEQIKEIA